MGIRHKQTGFTIVELLIVIVVIGILAAIVIVAYNGITTKARTAVMQADLETANKQLAVYLTGNTSGVATYPTGIDCSASPAANTICLKASNGGTFSYSYNSSANTFCLSEKNSGVTYFVNSTNNTPTAGLCPLNWTTLTASSQGWTSMSGSASGQVLIAATAANGIFMSTDSGATWSTRTLPSSSNQIAAVAASGDGNTLAAVESSGSGRLYTSTNGGVTWNYQFNAGNHIWRNVAISSNGAKIVASYSGDVVLSSDHGTNWTAGMSGYGRLPSNKDWAGLAMSSDGNTIYLGGRAGSSIGMYKTTNFGASNWTNISTASACSIRCDYIATNSDASKVLATSGSATPFLSTNGGSSWTQPSGFDTNVSWGGLALSSDGTKMLAFGSGNELYTSTDSGVTWNKDTSLGSRSPAAAVSSSDGNTVFMPSIGGSIYKGTY